MTLLQIETRHVEPDITILEFTGNITAAESRRVEVLVEDLLKQNYRKLVFDLTEVNYIDSSGMGSIAHCFARAIRNDGGLRVAGVNSRVKHLFHLTRLDAVFPFYATSLAACAGFEPAAKPGEQLLW
ncbi:MAG TPA: STAS domain-containing protein [Bryobacterales bacterium]|nr:STAS domain-containing protein [Bryobacterales bacterium]